MDPMPQLKVLYLDDEPDICDVFSELYSNEKVSVRTFTQPTMAIEFAKSNPPDIIFLDYRLPSTNGDLVALAMDSRIPKCLISGDIMIKTNYDFFAVFKKPWKVEEIENLLESRLKLKLEAHS
jgi:CheY-like chemotaxis protein